jgi:membrane protein required for colicin V production
MEHFVISDFNYLDVVIGAIVTLLAIKGFLNGFIREIFGLLGLLGGVYFGSRFSEYAATFIDKNFLHIENQAILQLIGFLTVLIAIWIGATLLGSLFSKLTTVSGLGFINRILGFIAGGGKYFLIFSLIITAFSHVTFLNSFIEKYTQNSLLYPYLKQTGDAIIQIDPESLGIKLPKASVIQTKERNQTKPSTDSPTP